MTHGLKTTILVSTALAGVLNLMQFATSYSQASKTAFVPDWAEAAPASPAPAATPKSPLLTPAAPAETAPAPAAAPAPTAAPTPTPAPVVAVGARLSAAGLKPEYAASYLNVQARTGTPWQILASVHRIETHQSGDTAIKSYAGATGPMQFMPRTFAAYALDGDGDGTKTITDVDDALLSAGNYLRANGAAAGKYNQALYAYNHSNTYVSNVMATARTLGL